VGGGLSPARRRAVLVVAIGAIALDTALLGLIAPLLPTIERRLGASEAELGIALGAYAVPILFVSLPLGRLADSIGRAPLLLGGLLLTVVGSVMIAFSDSLGPLIAGRAVQGIGSAASWIAALALVSDLAPAGRKGESIGYALAANSVGAIGGPALGGLTGETIGFEFPFLLVGGLAAALALCGLLILPRGRLARREPAADTDASAGADPDPDGEAIGRAGWRALLSVAVSGPVLPAALMVVVGAAVLGLVEVVVPLDGNARLGLSAAAIGGLFAAAVTLDAIAAPIAGRQGDRRGRLPVALTGLAMLALSAVMLGALEGIGGLVAGLAVFGIGVSVVFASAVPWLDDAFGSLDRGFGYGVLNVIYSIGYVVGPLGAGVALGVGGTDLAYGLAGLGVVLVAAVLVIRRRELRPPSEKALRFEPRPGSPPH
jgi:MFS family permease